MQKYFLTKIDFEKKMISNEDYHHIKNVMRMKKNDLITICFEKQSYIAKIINISDVIEYEIIEQLKENNELPIYITLIQGLPKKDKLEFIVEKTTELGVSEIIPVQMHRSIAKVNENEQNKIIRLNKICKEASEQANRNKIPVISSFKTSLKQIDTSSYDLKFVLNFGEYQNQESLFKNIFKDKQITKICFVVGPEGGITQEEVSYLKEIGFINISLGPRTLRCETASLYFLSMLSYILEMGDINV